MRQTAIFPLPPDPDAFKAQLLDWADDFSVAVYLDSNGHAGPYSSWECLVAAGVCQELTINPGTAFSTLQDWQMQAADWLFGTFSYDLKNEVEALHSGHTDGIGWPGLYFFQPETVVGIRHGQVEIFSKTGTPSVVWDNIRSIVPVQDLPGDTQPDPAVASLRARFSKADYLHRVDALRQHIIAGDAYEITFCQEFFAEDFPLDPKVAFQRLNALSRAPFSAYFKLHDRYVCSASPERFLKKTGDQLLSQPIKGTRRRGSTPAADAAIRQELSSSEKDRAENVMIVDLVRNDLARNCRPGSVRVDELYGLHTFETVHQLISTISGRLRPGIAGLQALRDAFPMGSMTGAPKVMAMQLIEQYERTRRGLYAGAVGYINPEGDFDFNVVIRSILYNAQSQYVSMQVGGAIVYDSVPEAEYDECLVKAAAMLRVLGY